MLMNFVSVKTQDKSLTRDAGSSAPSMAQGGITDLTSENQIAVSGESTSEKNHPEGGEEVERPSHRASRSKGPSVPDLPAAPRPSPPPPKSSKPPTVRATSPTLPTSGSNLLSKRSRADTGAPGLAALSVGADVPAITRFLHESLNLSDAGLGTRPQLVEAHAKFINNVSEVFYVPLFVCFYPPPSLLISPLLSRVLSFFS